MTTNNPFGKLKIERDDSDEKNQPIKKSSPITRSTIRPCSESKEEKGQT